MRITILCGGSRVFGLEIMALTIARGLRARGHEVMVLINGWNDGDFARRLRDADLPFEAMYFGKLSKSLRPRAIWYTFNALRHLPEARKRLRDHLASFTPDIIIVYNRDWALQARGMLERNRTIFHVHELPETTSWSRRIYRSIDGLAAAIVAVSEHIGVRLRTLGVDQSKTVVIRNGLAFPHDLESSTSSTRAVTVGIVGQIGSWKGHEDLFEALAVLRRNGRAFRCVVAGSGDTTYVSFLRAKATQLQIAEVIEWRGYVSEPSAIYADLDVVIVPSRFEEPFGLVAAEAAGRGIPVIATRRGGLPEIVVDGVTGFLVEAFSPPQLAERLDMLLTDESLRKKLGAAARERALREFSADRMVSEMAALCERLIEAKPVDQPQRLAM